MLARSDVDMRASAYVDGLLGPPEPGAVDALTVVPFAGGRPGPAAAVPVSNAVVAWPSNLAVTPDGGTAFVLSYLPEGHPRRTAHSSLTLLALDPASGRLAAMGTVPFAGVLPEGITFDASGCFLAVANFLPADPARRGATVDLWRLEGADDARAAAGARLVPTGTSISVPRGAHILKVVR